MTARFPTIYQHNGKKKSRKIGNFAGQGVEPLSPSSLFTGRCEVVQKALLALDVVCDLQP